jgi:AFG3 family protein
MLRLSSGRAGAKLFRSMIGHRNQGFLLARQSSRLLALSNHKVSSIKDILDWMSANPPPGFEKFFPGAKKAVDEKEESKNEKKSDSDGNGNGGNRGDQNDNKAPFGIDPKQYFLLGLILVAVLGLSSLSPGGITQKVSFQEFLRDYVDKERVQSIVVNENNEAFARLKTGAQTLSFTIGSIDSFERSLENFQLDMGVHPKDFIPINYQKSPISLSDGLSLVTAALFAWFIFQSFSRFRSGGMGGGAGRNIFSIGKSNAQIINPENVKISFKDVAGLDEAKVEVMEFVDFLKDPKRFEVLGAKIPKGALLVGPPGTGKTLLAKAVAGEAQVPFFSISGSDFMEMFVGVGPSRVRDLFAQARSKAPSIVFIDEIDAVGRSRSGRKFGGGNDERENTLNQLLVEMDGFQTTAGVVVLAGTNRVDILDSALLRPGRFDRQILVDRPDIKGRHQIFMVHLQKLKIADKPEYIAERMAALTPGFVGADIANICNEAALIAARKKLNKISLKEFEDAVDRVIGGLEKKSKIISEEERRIVAFHEAGHAVAGWFLEHADPVLKVTIVPRGQSALGYAQYLPKEVALYSQRQLEDKMCMAFGGRVAEKIFFGEVSTGAANDLQKITQIAYSQVLIYGMNEKIGNVSFPPDENSQFLKPYSDQTAIIVDEEARNIVTRAYDRTIQLLEEKKELVQKLAERLLKEETINHDVIVEVLGERPFKHPSYLDFLHHKRESESEKPEEQSAKEKEESPPSPVAAFAI